GAVAIRLMPDASAPQSRKPIHDSQTASASQERSELGGIVSGCRRHGAKSRITGRAMRYLDLLAWVANVIAGSSIVITRLAPRFPHTGAAPSPTRIVTTGNVGASSGHGVLQSVTITSRSIGAIVRSTKARSPSRKSVPPPPNNSTFAAEKTRRTFCTAASHEA